MLQADATSECRSTLRQYAAHELGLGLVLEHHVAIVVVEQILVLLHYTDAHDDIRIETGGSSDRLGGVSLVEPESADLLLKLEVYHIDQVQVRQAGSHQHETAVERVVERLELEFCSVRTIYHPFLRFLSRAP